MRLLHDVFGAVGPQPSERLSVVALAKLPRIVARAKRILESNRAVLNEFLASREELEVVRTESGTTSFPRLLKGKVEDLYTVLHEKYDTGIVPGRFFESPQHFRVGMCAEPELFKEGVKRLGAALDDLRNLAPLH
jgi:aspartate/methionine/tyrosine aminotransferase